MFTNLEVDFIWLAGFIDGEGSFCIQKVLRKWLNRQTYQGSLNITSTTITIIEELKKWLGGSVTYYKPAKYGQKPYARWDLSQRRVEELIPNILPYLKIKRIQAETFMAYMSRIKHQGGCYYTDEDRTWLETMYQGMKAYNQRGI